MARKSRKNVEAAIMSMASTRISYSAAAYKRLSADDTKKRGDSLETQHNIIENFIASAPDIQLCGSYVDNKATGTNFARPGFQKMIADCESGRINCIIVKDLSRFGRNAIDVGYYLEKYLPSIGVRVIAITDDYDSNDGGGGILLPLKNLIAESYALDIGRKCRSVWQQKIEAGEFVGRLAPYGYLRSPQDCHKLIIDPDTAPVVRQIFEWAAEGVRKLEIAHRLSELKILSPSHDKKAKGESVSGKNIGNGHWHKTTLENILSDRVYCGDLVQGKDRRFNNQCIVVPPENWITVKNTHEPIVSSELFDAANNLLQRLATRDVEKRREVVPYSENLFKGKIFCAICGHAMAYKRQNKDGTYWYRCESQVKYGKDACVLVSVKEADLKTEIIALLHRYSEAILGRYITLERTAAPIITTEAELRVVNDELNTASRMLKSLFESMVSGLITQNEFIQMKADYEQKVKTLTERANEIRNSRYNAEAEKLECRDLADAVSSVLSDKRLTAEIVDKLIDKILVNPDKSVQIFFSFENEFKGVA